MNRTVSYKENSWMNTILLASVYLCVASGFLFVMALCRLSDKPVGVLLASRPGIISLLALPVFVASGGILLHQYLRTRADESKQFVMTIMMTLVTVVVVFTIGELAIRVFSHRTPEGVVFTNTPLLPRSWNDVATRYREILKKASASGSYLVYDDLMGWTVRPNRRSADGLYFSSTEGIRSPRTEIAFANIPAKHRVALVGDSFTFGLDVKFEDSWGHQLEQLLGPEFQVLNFGVDGYGVDQAYLRYTRDVRPWHPDIVILGFINHDLYRSMGVYAFLTFPGGELPFAKPRFVLEGGKLKVLNLPPSTPDDNFSKRTITELPFIEYDRSYNQSEWQWHFFHHSYLFRYFVSRFPLWETPSGNLLDEYTKSVNREILRSFVQLATAENSIPIIVYFPARISFSPFSSHTAGEISFAFSALRDMGIECIDLTRCVTMIPEADRFVVGRPHYSPQANAAVAKCLYDVVLKHSSRMKLEIPNLDDGAKDPNRALPESNGDSALRGSREQ